MIWDCSDITFSQFLDIKAIEKRNGKEGFVDTMIEVAEMWHDKVDDMPFGNVQQIRALEVGELITISGWYMHIMQLIQEGLKKAEKDFIKEFEYKGEKYVFADEKIDTVMGLAFTAGQVVEALEYQNLYHKMAEENEVWDLDCAFEFELGLREVALLCLKEGEALPYKRGELDVWLNKRVKHLEGLPMDIVLSVRFFLLNGLQKYVKTQTINHFSKDRDGKRGMSNQGLKLSKRRNMYFTGRGGKVYSLARIMRRSFTATLRRLFIGKG